MDQQAIDRDTYRQIKKMSREELNAFLIRYAQNLCKPVDLRDMEKRNPRNQRNGREAD